MEIYIVEDDVTVISILEDIIEDNELGTVCGTTEGGPANVDEILALEPDVCLLYTSEYMCVPFGKILRGKVIPNTVTKTLHTDKVFDPELKEDAIEAFPYYSPLSSQIKGIKSFDRPVILVDDLLHRGGRFEALEPMFKDCLLYTSRCV